ncbi:ovochymase-2 isoform X2 [Ochotona princeps]|uniref:ovochymase-2 isoform X2 n=1 Tax=Ochotona princeps TaxID=9978 RepID=UPI002714862B|nr:ovochymase-2 isoform X2 [Ochotona princeps]
MPVSMNKLVLVLGVIYLDQAEFATLSLPQAPNCGQRQVRTRFWNNFNIFSRIVGGSQVEKGSYPWQVSLKQGQKHICGGTIISSQWVITAAHCITSRNIGANLNVTAGEHDLSQKEPEEQTFRIKTVIIHPHFSTGKPMDYDIALLKMAGTFQFGQFVGPLCLPKPGKRFETGLVCTTAGWGRLTEDGVFSQVLQEVKLPILSQEKCVAALLTLKRPFSGKTFLCTGFPEGGRDACQGDSGGSLMCQSNRGIWTMAGVTSWGLGCGRGWRNNALENKQGSPGIFTDLSKVLPWIYEHIRTGNKKKSTKAQCSEQHGVVSGSEGELHFPESLLLYYESKQLCVWTLLVPQAMHVLLNFSRLDVESCEHNYLSIYSLEDRLIDSGCNSLTVLFEEGIIQSLHYPENYSDMADCNWIFQAPQHHLIKLSFQSLEIEENGDCTSDYVTVHKDVEGKEEIARMCGYDVPSPVLSSSGVMLISFQSDEHGTSKGFQATVSFLPAADVNISTSEDDSQSPEAWKVPPGEIDAPGETWMQRDT